MTSHDGPDGIEREITHGRTIARAASDARLPFLVHSTIGGVERRSGVPHFESKRRIEEFLLDAVPVTFVRPTFFMETLRLMFRRDSAGAQLAMPLPRDVPLQLISVRDIGRAAATLLLGGDQGGGAAEIAADELTGEQIAARITDHVGVPTTFVEVPLDVLGDDEDLKMMFRWLARPPSYQADFERTRHLVPDLEDLPGWLSRQTTLDPEAGR
jgi:uncharacterized protein YbjT (DUF2867 family)